MAIELAKESIDLGIVVTDLEASLAFYRDTLGFVPAGEMDLPGGGTMQRLLCGTSVIKLLAPTKTPRVLAPPGGIQGATGYRYWTITVTNLEAVVASCAEAGYTIAIPLTTLRPGVVIAIVADPDGNWVELVQIG
ncbi:MAG: hypothetical protein JWL72_3240 [Ilumatobacteraceae bacterium]|nr:hypothetical protein [Ilumatobacteraceae bacterium]